MWCIHDVVIQLDNRDTQSNYNHAWNHDWVLFPWWQYVFIRVYIRIIMLFRFFSSYITLTSDELCLMLSTTLLELILINSWTQDRVVLMFHIYITLHWWRRIQHFGDEDKQRSAKRYSNNWLRTGIRFPHFQNSQPWEDTKCSCGAQPYRAYVRLYLFFTLISTVKFQIRSSPSFYNASSSSNTSWSYNFYSTSVFLYTFFIHGIDIVQFIMVCHLLIS